jgi:hypothetical protein
MTRHSCYTCRPSNRDQVVSDLAGLRMARYRDRFRGPPGNVNGGVAVGSLVCPALDHAAAAGAAHPVALRVRARLRSGVPVEEALDVTVSGPNDAVAISVKRHEAELIHGVAEVAVRHAAPAPGDIIAPVPPERADALGEMAQVPVPERPPFWEETGEHPIAGCFSCGPENDAGLHVFPRFVSDGVVCAPWEPDPSFDDGGGVLSAMVLTAALDCSSGICMPLDQQRDLLKEDAFFLLGTLDVRYLRVPPLSPPGGYRVVARALDRDGRKFFGLSALFDGDGAAYAMAEATWIVAPITRTQAWGGR